jgi:hypothetical protein
VIATLAVGNQAREPFGFIQGQPMIDRIGITWFQQALLRYSIRGLPLADFQNGATAFSHIGVGMMVAILFQASTLCRSQLNGAADSHLDSPAV